MKKYNIVRFRLNKSDVGHAYMGGISGGKFIKKGLTLAEAKAHCNDPQNNSETCTSTRVNGTLQTSEERRLHAKSPWFDGYKEAAKGSIGDRK
jgi:hypothetical protein